MLVKVVDKVVHRDPEDPGTIVERYRDRYVTTVATLSQHGLELIQDVDSLTRFMRQYGDKIAAPTLETYQPLYDLKPKEAELAFLERLGKARKALSRPTQALRSSTIMLTPKKPAIRLMPNNPFQALGRKVRYF